MLLPSTQTNEGEKEQNLLLHIRLPPLETYHLKDANRQALLFMLFSQPSLRVEISLLSKNDLEGIEESLNR